MGHVRVFDIIAPTVELGELRGLEVVQRGGDVAARIGLGAGVIRRQGVVGGEVEGSAPLGRGGG